MTKIDFNPRSCEGATLLTIPQQKRYQISIHAPAKERRDYIMFQNKNFDFNPRSCEGATQTKII